MTFQKFLSFLMFPFSIIACVIVLVFTSVLWIPFILCRVVNDIVWKLFEAGGFSFHMQGAINWLDDTIIAFYAFAALIPSMCMQAFDNDLY